MPRVVDNIPFDSCWLELGQVTDETIRDRVAQCRLLAEEDPTDSATLHSQLLAEHRLSWGVRGDNNPDYARYLGYISSKELYPDFEPTDFRSFLESVVEGKARNVYVDDRSVVVEHTTALEATR